jgi:hypothetical protein
VLQCGEGLLGSSARLSEQLSLGKMEANRWASRGRRPLGLARSACLGKNHFVGCSVGCPEQRHGIQFHWIATFTEATSRFLGRVCIYWYLQTCFWDEASSSHKSR